MSNKEINPRILKEIKKYVKKLSNTIDAKSSEIKDFEEEMTSNLIMSFEDLFNDGYSEQEALKLTFNKFGKTNTLKNDLSKLYKFKEVYHKNLLKFTIAIGIICALLFTVFQTWNFVYLPKLRKQVFTTLKTEISNNIDVNSTEFHNQIDDIVNNNWGIYSLSLSYTDNYSYENDINNRLIYRFPVANKEDSWKNDIGEENYFIFKNPASSNFEYDTSLEKFNYNAQISVREFGYNFFVLAEMLLAIYWVMFTIWGSLEVYFNEDSNLWTLLFLLTNFIGYLVYLLYKKGEMKGRRGNLNDY